MGLPMPFEIAVVCFWLTLLVALLLLVLPPLSGLVTLFRAFNAIALCGLIVPEIQNWLDVQSVHTGLIQELFWLWALLCCGLFWTMRARRKDIVPLRIPVLSTVGLLAYRGFLFLINNYQLLA